MFFLFCLTFYFLHLSSKTIPAIKNRFQTLLYKNAHSRAAFTVFGLVIMEVRMSFRQFFTWKYPLSSLFRTTAILGSSILRLLLGRSLKYSFSFAGEDRI